MSVTNGTAARPGDPAIRQALKDALEEILPGLVADALEARAADGEPVAQVPAPPVAAVHRPRTGTPASQPLPSAAAVKAEPVSIRSDAELDAFVRMLAERLEHPGARQALRTGALRFTLGGAAAPAASLGARRVERGAVTERLVEEAARAGGRLVLGPRAVLTPLGRDRARALSVTIEKETRC
ncbi:MAG: hypothetical protein EXQ81_07660 [Thermoleophilia bacterium]|nr:hypothetical protein [Thermoleophilia bacterium]